MLHNSIHCLQQNPLVPTTFVNQDFRLIRTTSPQLVRINDVCCYTVLTKRNEKANGDWTARNSGKNGDQ
jgi:hypothetical protein